MAYEMRVPQQVMDGLKALGQFQASGSYLAFAVRVRRWEAWRGSVPLFDSAQRPRGKEFIEAVDLESKYGLQQTALIDGLVAVKKALDDLTTAARHIHKAYLDASSGATTDDKNLAAALKNDLGKVDQDLGWTGQDSTGGLPT